MIERAKAWQCSGALGRELDALRLFIRQLALVSPRAGRLLAQLPR